MDSGFETPIALFVFNRPETTRRVFEAVASVRPKRLLLIADGARASRSQEPEICREVRDIVDRVDWPCEVSRNYAETNLGCQSRVASGLDWVFSLVEEAIILEDDCLPDPSFFPFCRELLERFRGDDRVAYVSGINPLKQSVRTDSSYFFSEIGGIWGWATWRSEWQRYDRNLEAWPEMKREGLLSEMFADPRVVAHWTEVFDQMHAKTGPDTWDFQWTFTNFKNHSLIAVASKNLITNIGFGPDATHTVDEDSRMIVPRGSLSFPLRHPASFIPLRSADRVRARNMLPPALPIRAWRKLRRALRARG